MAGLTMEELMKTYPELLNKPVMTSPLYGPGSSSSTPGISLAQAMNQPTVLEPRIVKIENGFVITMKAKSTFCAGPAEVGEFFTRLAAGILLDE